MIHSIDEDKIPTIKKYIVFTGIEHKYTKLNTSLEEAEKKDPSTIRTIMPGTILYSQDTPFTVEQTSEIKTKGWHYQWGFGPCWETIPFEKIKFGKIEEFNV